MATNDVQSEELRKKAYEAVDAYLDAGGQLPLIVVNQDWLEKQPIIEKLLSETRVDELSLYDKDPRDWYYYYSDRIQSLNEEEKTVMPTTNPETNEELEAVTTRLWTQGVTSSEDESIDYEQEMKIAIEAINRYVAKEVKAARIDELSHFLATDMWIYRDGTDLDFPIHSKPVNTRITELQKEETQ